MSDLYKIVKSLQEAQGNINKQAILVEHKDNELFKEYMRAVYDPGINFWIKKLPKVSAANLATVDAEFIEWILKNIAGREITGNQAISTLKQCVASMDEEGQELVTLMLNRSIGASVGNTMVLKTWPNLYFTVPYQRCSLLDAKAKEKFSKLPLMYVQEKCDGSFLYLVKEAGKAPEAITRAGSKYPKEFSAMLASGVPDGVVLIGELLVYPHFYSPYEPCNRQVGNGMLNSILKGGEVDANFDYKMTAWDILTPEEFKAGKSEYTYDDRLTELQYVTDHDTANNISFVSTMPVFTLEAAYKIYSDFTAQGKEGAVLKTGSFLWKDGTSKDCVKMKIEFEIDLKITGVIEGSGKASGMMGALQLTSSCGDLTTDVGTGFTDDLRKVFWMQKHDMIGKIVSIKANDIIRKRDRNTKSLFLPVFIEERLDKTEADSLEDCQRILDAAKGLK